ncbi:MAG: OmpW family outer membrane protein [Wenzhouxiangellaceae bacterium]|nr:OmpW family outer membrane protein [Wenzhouxiangellaceae bacterium]
MRAVSRQHLLAATALAAAMAAPAMAQEQGDWLFRVGAGYIATDTSNDDLVFEGNRLDNFRIDVDDQIGLVFDVTYFLSPHWGIELLASAPFEHDIDGEGALAGLNRIGETKHLPPTLSLQYHFLPNQTIRPYVGAGLNYTLFFDDSLNQRLHEGVVATANGALGTNFSGGKTSLDIDDSFGLGLQAGFDFDVTEKWFLNFNVRYIQIEVDADIRTRTFDPNGEAVRLDSNIDVDIDPWIFSSQVGFRF